MLALSLGILLIYLIVYIRIDLVNVLRIEGNYVQVWTLASLGAPRHSSQLLVGPRLR
ncbi:MAG: hypothetical protein R3B96_18170 [Pirellulaceae bacterium]